jgi:DNA-binding MarR family transcriptional regulator
MTVGTREPKPAKHEEVDSMDRFYAALVGLTQNADPRQTCRRQVMGMLQAISARIRARGKASAGTTGYHASVHYILVLLHRANPQHTIKAREIQRGLGYTAGGMTRRLDAMVRDGLVTRLPDPDDGRAWLAQLTPKGAELAHDLLARGDDRSKRLEQALSVREWQTLAKLLQRLGDAID